MYQTVQLWVQNLNNIKNQSKQVYTFYFLNNLFDVCDETYAKAEAKFSFGVIRLKPTSQTNPSKYIVSFSCGDPTSGKIPFISVGKYGEEAC